MLTLSDVYEALTKKRAMNVPGIEISDVVVDSRLAKPSSLFIALKG